MRIPSAKLDQKLRLTGLNPDVSKLGARSIDEINWLIDTSPSRSNADGPRVRTQHCDQIVQVIQMKSEMTKVVAN